MANSAPYPADNSGNSGQTTPNVSGQPILTGNGQNNPLTDPGDLTWLAQGYSSDNLTDDATSATNIPNVPIGHAGGRRKEVLNSPLPGESVASETVAVSESAPSGAQTENLAPSEFAPPEQTADQPAEYESGKAELEPTIEKLQQEIEQNKMKAPDKIAVRQDNSDQAVPKTVAQPVVILPITEDKMSEARKKSPAYSIKWLYTWAKRQIKKFQDILVVYRDKPKERQ